MATKAAISIEEHLRTPYEREPEFVGGELEERPPGKVKQGGCKGECWLPCGDTDSRPLA